MANKFSKISQLYLEDYQKIYNLEGKLEERVDFKSMIGDLEHSIPKYLLIFNN
jgi:hypothetical protein